MNIIFDDQAKELIEKRHIVLELDTIKTSADRPIVAYCVIEQMPLGELSEVEMYKDLHQNLIKNYGLKNWKYCLDAIGHLMGRWGGEVDSFYQEMQSRILLLQNQDLDESWSPVLDKTV